MTPTPTAVLPSPVVGLTLTPLDSAIGVSFTEPSFGTGDELGYVVTATPDPPTGDTFTYIIDAGDTAATLLALINDTAYSVKVETVTTVGRSVPVIGFTTPTRYPTGTVPPGTPVDLVVTPLNDALDVSWSAPASMGTYALSDYLIRSHFGETFQRWYTTTDTTGVLADLSNEYEWEVEVWARTGAGPSVSPATGSGTPSSNEATPEEWLTALPFAPLSPTPGTNPIYYDGWQDPNEDAPPVEEPPPPEPIVINPPSLYAFYPAGVNDSTGVFAPSNWAGL